MLKIACSFLFCGPQNKNYTLFTMLTTIVNNPDVACQQIVIRYLTKGHTHNAADFIHGNIEKRMKKRGHIYDFPDYLDCVNKPRKTRIIISQSATAFRYWVNGKKYY